MSAREAIIREIQLAPESVVREAYDFILFLKSRSREQRASQSHGASDRPDFLARQQALFGGRVVQDSQAILDEMREERF
jgi:hypothetical protein